MVVEMSTYTVTYERDESGWWFASVAGVHGCHTQGRTIQEAERRIREALGLFVEDADEAELERNVMLPDDLEEALEEYRAARDELERAQTASSEAAERAASELSARLQLSVRDMTNFLDLSHQRIQQIIAARKAGQIKRKSTEQSEKRRKGTG